LTDLFGIVTGSQEKAKEMAKVALQPSAEAQRQADEIKEKMESLRKKQNSK